MQKRAYIITVQQSSLSYVQVRVDFTVAGVVAGHKTYSLRNIEGRELDGAELASLAATVKRWTRNWAAQGYLF